MSNYVLFNRDSHTLRERIASEKDPMKAQVLQCYIDKTMPVKLIAREFGVSTRQIYEWLRIFAAEKPKEIMTRPHASRPHASAAVAADAIPTSDPTPPSAMAKKYEAPQNLPDDPELLKKMILELDYKVHSRDVMIEVAEEMFGIQIKKKRGTKP